MYLASNGSYHKAQAGQHHAIFSKFSNKSAKMSTDVKIGKICFLADDKKIAAQTLAQTIVVTTIVKKRQLKYSPTCNPLLLLQRNQSGTRH